MKATTCVRVVLPTDELVRMECAATMTVADLVRTLEKRASFQKAIGVDGNGERDYGSCDNNNCDNDPATETTLGCRSKEFISKLSRGKLTLVRMESELKEQALVVDEVEELDILEFQLASIDTPEWIPELNFRQSRRISPIINSSPHKMLEAVRPASTTLIPLYQVKQDRAFREEISTNPTCAVTTGFDSHPKVRFKDLIQYSKVIRSLFRRCGARRRLTSRNGRKRLLFTHFQEVRNDAKQRKYTERALLRAGMQLIELLHLLQKDVRGLVFLLRDAILGGIALSMSELLSLVRTMVKTLTHINLDSSASTSYPDDDNESLVRRLSWDIAGKDGSVTIILEGWVVTAEWGAFWRSQRKEYACLCDNHTLYFFSSRTHCADFVFELGRERDGSVSETSKRLLKVNSPLSQIDLSETDWSVRKSIQEEDSGKLHRNAFAFFDPNGRMRLVLDVSSGAEATTWARLISAEMSQSKLFARMRELNHGPAISEPEERADNVNPLTTWTEILVQSLSTISDQQSLIIPLHSLYSQIDRRNGTARAERHKSWTLGQALKDLQRDCVKINSLVFAGASLEANILALTLEILKCTEAEQNTTAKARRAGDTITSLSVNAKEMTALRFARQVIIYSSRTHGGGDILDAMHLLFGNEKVCICPDAHSMEPIEIHVSKEVNTEVPLSARITMKMTYRVIPTDSIGPMDEQTDSFVQDGAAEQQITEFKIVGTYSQKVSCHFIEGNDIEGSVQLQAAG
ncbi:hypothetical protein JG687_00001388 [Phytophthora cactorum]|uniref:PH domain-containing protein n=1 Tax=Phytophthora cactorum TaxID=29920 RepID=A0A8T1V209_9STRA|nr:hypothetical protein PC123_g7962 [Phytophthora cactorum]KAG6972582.1 hypothetical protein JG687_00001388 [Phytophthora cactorum]